MNILHKAWKLSLVMTLFCFAFYACMSSTHLPEKEAKDKSIEVETVDIDKHRKVRKATADVHRVLISNNIRSISADESSVWVATLRGVSRLDRATNTWTHYTKDDGLGSDAVYVVVSEGRWVWFGTDNGVTALQMDIKIQGITEEIMSRALEQAKEGRMHILGCMAQVITEPRTDLSEFAPRMYTMKVPVDKIRDVIGKGGATIRSIIEETGVSIDIDDTGKVNVAAVDNASAQKALDKIHALTADLEVGEIYDGTVVKIMDFGAFVAVLPGKEGLVHISQIAHERVNQVTDYLQEGQAVRVKVIEIDRQGRVRLSMKALIEESA